MITKIADSKGRLNFGKRYANKTFIIEQTGEMEMKLEITEEISEREAWLHANPEAKKKVLAALERLAAGEVSEAPPDLDADRSWISELED